jgi:2-polyprenyl-6-methoxyphenol hydroxylase-like FAD-dependent oxidoreductase
LLKAPDSPDELSAMIGIHRRLLHQALADAATGAELTTGARVTAVQAGTPGAEPAEVSWESAGESHTATADLVVGADGIRSSTRAAVFPARDLVYSGYSSWRAITADATLDDRFAMVWGPNAEFGALRISADQVYWYGYVALPAGHRFPDELRAAREYFASWAPDVRALVGATGPDELIRHDVSTLAEHLPGYIQGRTVLIGDAAHPMLPTLGQGANSALEDGVSLGALVRANHDLAAGLADYEAQRYRRTRKLVDRSAQLAKIGAHLGPGVRQTLRNGLLRVIPARTAQRSGTQVLDWSVPVPHCL